MSYRLCKENPEVVDGLNFASELGKAAKDWNDEKAGITFSAVAQSLGCVNDGAEGFTQVFYVDPNDMEDYCRSPIAEACAKPYMQSDHEHYKAHDLIYVYPMHKGRRWTQYSHQAQMNVVYVRSVMAHELGHVGGLGHAKTSESDASLYPLMRDGYNHRVLQIQDYDKDAMEIIYEDGHTAH